MRDKMEAFARRVVRGYLPDQHREFYSQLPFVLLGTVDDDGLPWASLVAGRSGFISSRREKTLTIGAKPMLGDPLNETLKAGADVGLLGIQLETRRRNRLTGRIDAVHDDGFSIEVRQTFGNCPQYIQTRAVKFESKTDERDDTASITRSDRLDDAMRALIERSDTLFIATSYAEDDNEWSNGADVSHRGGKPGFVKVEDDRALVFPDFSGNNHFNTVGNIVMNPKAGFLFPDFDSGDMLYVSGEAEIIWEGPHVKAFAGAERLIRCRIKKAIRVEQSLPFQFDFDEFSPMLDLTGSWERAEELISVENERNAYIQYEVYDTKRESDVITSYYLRRADRVALAPYQPGQFLPLRLNIPGADAPIMRTYTVSDAPNGDYYRLSIKREENEAIASNFFHDHVEPGFRFEAMAPRGKFVLDQLSDRPVVLISAGVGVTPMIAMVNFINNDGRRTRDFRKTFFIHGAANSDSHGFADHIRRMASEHETFNAYVCYSRPGDGDALGVNHDFEGRIDVELLKRILPFDDYDFYLCGPGAFMQDLYEGLTALGVRETQIHYESFGPASVLTRAPASADDPLAKVSGDPINVCFAKSGVDVEWSPEKGTLLELAEAAGVDAAFSCRSGICGTCATRLQCGAVDYVEEPTGPLEADEILICCSTPRLVTGENSCGDECGIVLDL